ncbi:Crp/Fnr family transcriptional regulator [Hymenobacter bucti]|uniref:Crp/Fnr family transcriptional regulator n=1 Tax=Hymenobacter bucti TaxID=1844114 RepID=A0ABW4QZ82_9BACT
MDEIFLNYLTARGTFTDAELQQLVSATLVKQLKRRELLLRQGEVCRYMAFVVSGCLRLYRTGEDAVEHILRFAPENWWLNDYESFRSGQPAKSTIDALEDTLVLLWSKESWERLKREIPTFDALQNHLLIRSLDAQVDRLHTTISLPAEERYHAFLTSFPNLYQRVPLHMIASYLGVTRKTLGRIRQHTSL